MKCRIAALVIALFCFTATAHAVPDPAVAVPSDALFYAEIRGETLQQIVAVAALPPVARLAMPEVNSPFAYLDKLLKLEQGTATEAITHLGGAAFGGMAEEGPFVVLTFDDEKWPLTLMQSLEKDESGMVSVGEASMACRGPHLFIGEDDTCELLRSGDFTALSDVPSFARAREDSGDCPLLVYLNVHEALALAREETPPYDRDELEIIALLFDLDHVECATLSAARLPEPGSMALNVYLDGEGAGALSLLPESGLQMAAQLPAETAAACVLNWGPAESFFGGLWDLLAQMGPMTMRLEPMEAEWGFTLKDLYSTLGSGMAVFLPAGAEGGFIGREDITAVLLLKKPAQFKSHLETLLTQGGQMPITPVSYEGVEMQRLMMPPVTYAISEDRMVIGGGPPAVKRYLEGQSEAAPGAQEAPPRGAAMLYLDPGYLLQSYPQTKSGGRLICKLSRSEDRITLEATGEDMEPEALGRAYLSAYFGMAAMLMPALARARMAAREASVHNMRPPVGPPQTFPTPRMAPLKRARMQARKAASMQNLHYIGLGIMMSCDAHDGQFPPNLAVLLEERYLDGEEVFIDPADPDPPTLPGTDLKCSYRYAGPLPKDVPPRMIISYSRRGIHPGERVALYADNAVRTQSEAELHMPGGARGMSLEECYQWIIDHHGDELTPEQKSRFKDFYEVH